MFELGAGEVNSVDAMKAGDSELDHQSTCKSGDMVACTYNPRTEMAKTGRFLGLTGQPA